VASAKGKKPCFSSLMAVNSTEVFNVPINPATSRWNASETPKKLF
jgi:hypothetical protein